MSRGARYILLSVVAFALMNVAVKATSGLPFHLVVFWRAAITLLITYFYLRHVGVPVWGHNRKLLIGRGVAGTVALTCYFHSLHHMPLATAVTVQYLSPLLTVVVAGLVFRERVSALHWLCALIGFAGVYVIQGFDDRVSAFTVGVGALGALASAFAYNSVRGLRETDHEWVVMFYFPLVATLALAPWALWDWRWPTAREWALLAVIGLVTQLGQLFLTRGYQADSAAKVASVNYLGVVFAVGFGALFFGESLGVGTAAGIGLIILSVALSSLTRARGNRGS